MAPAESLARLRKHVLDRVTRGGVTVATACREAGISRGRYYQLRRRYLAYGEAGLRPRPQPARPTRQLPAPLVDAILSYAIFHPTEGERSIARISRSVRSVSGPPSAAESASAAARRASRRPRPARRSTLRTPPWLTRQAP